jgi:hypothetical protein
MKFCNNITIFLNQKWENTICEVYGITKSKSFIGGAGIWTRGFPHAKRTLYHWVTPPKFFVKAGFAISKIRVPKEIDIGHRYVMFMQGPLKKRTEKLPGLI